MLKIKQIRQKTEMEEATPMIVKNTNFSKRFLVCFLGFWTFFLVILTQEEELW